MVLDNTYSIILNSANIIGRAVLYRSRGIYISVSPEDMRICYIYISASVGFTYVKLLPYHYAVIVCIFHHDVWSTKLVYLIYQ